MHTTENEPTTQPQGAESNLVQFAEDEAEEDDLTRLFDEPNQEQPRARETGEQTETPEREGRELDSDTVLGAWNALRSEQQQFILRGVISSNEQFEGVIGKYLETYRASGDKKRADRVVLMRGIRKLLVGFPDENNLALPLVQTAREMVPKFGVTEKDRERMRQAVGTNTAESVKQEIGARIKEEQKQLSDALDQRIRKLTENAETARVGLAA